MVGDRLGNEPLVGDRLGNEPLVGDKLGNEHLRGQGGPGWFVEGRGVKRVSRWLIGRQ